MIDRFLNVTRSCRTSICKKIFTASYLLFLVFYAASPVEATTFICSAVHLNGVVVDKHLASVVNTEFYTIKIVKDCIKKECTYSQVKEKCMDPKDIFTVKISSTGFDVIYISDRCSGGFIKYSKITDSDVQPWIYMEDNLYYKNKHKNIDGGLLVNYSYPIVIFFYNEKENWISVVFKDQQGGITTPESICNSISMPLKN